jgi:hypothetical protein
MMTGETDTSAPISSATSRRSLDSDTNPSAADPLNGWSPSRPTWRITSLYKAARPPTSNRPFLETELRLVGQKFMRGHGTKPAQTSIYRMFPASKSNTTDPDAAITSLNHNVEVLFKSHPDDVRGSYRLSARSGWTSPATTR